MRISERLRKKKQSDTTAEPIANEEFSVSSVFAPMDDITRNVIDLASKNRNIIFICSKSFDKLIISEYIKSLLPDTTVQIIDNNVSDTCDGMINIVPNPDIKTVIKILEQIMYGGLSFIFGLNLGSYDNVVNKIKVLIALNQKNLIAEDINTLISAANAVIVYVLKNNEGLFYFSKIEEITIDETGLKCQSKFHDSRVNDGLAFDNELKRNSREQDPNSFNAAKQESEHSSIGVAPAAECEQPYPSNSDEFLHDCEIKSNSKNQNQTKAKKQPKSQQKEIVISFDNNVPISEIKEQEEINKPKNTETQESTQENKPNKYQILREKLRNKRLTK